MNARTRRPVVVGVDGSSRAMAAVRWAAAEARRRDVPLRIVHGDVSSLVYLPELPTVPLPHSYRQAVRSQAEKWLQQAEEAAAGENLGITIETRMSTGSGSAVLIRESQTAQLVVVGSRGLGGFSGLIVGSVAVSLSTHGHCPVVVVRGELEDVEYAGRPVVVGVDGSRGGDAALDWAFQAAAAREVELIALHTWHEITTDDAWVRLQADPGSAGVQSDEERLLAEFMAGWSETYPEVRVHQRVVHDKAGRALLDQARHAQLVVVGARGRGGFAGLLLGSTSHTLIFHAACPVAVVR